MAGAGRLNGRTGRRWLALLAAVLLLHVAALDWIGRQLQHTGMLQPLAEPMFTRVLQPQAPPEPPAPPPAALHFPLWQLWMFEQTSHRMPAEPQAVFSTPRMHTPSAEQQPWQVLALQAALPHPLMASAAPSVATAAKAKSVLKGDPQGLSAAVVSAVPGSLAPKKRRVNGTSAARGRCATTSGSWRWTGGSTPTRGPSCWPGRTKARRGRPARSEAEALAGRVRRAGSRERRPSGAPPRRGLSG